MTIESRAVAFYTNKLKMAKSSQEFHREAAKRYHKARMWSDWNKQMKVCKQRKAQVETCHQELAQAVWELEEKLGREHR